MMTDYELNDIDSEDIGDLLVKIEDSFNITFVGKELHYIKTFGQLCDHIANKIPLDNVADCTNQQAFYKLRDAFATVLQMDKKIITPQFELNAILPKKSRRSSIKKINKHLGFKLAILRAPNWVKTSLCLLTLISLPILFFSWKIGLLILLFSLLGFRLANEFGNVLNTKTLGDVAEKMARENYLKSRRNPKTFNKNELT